MNDVDGPPYAYEHDCAARHADGEAALALVREHHDTLIALVGTRELPNGKIRTMSKNIDSLLQWREDMRGLVFKAAVSVLVAALAGGGLAVAIAKAL